MCLIPTAAADSEELVQRFEEDFAPLAEVSHLALFRRTIADIPAHLLAQDLIVVSGGNTASLLAVWRMHGVDTALREAGERGVVLSGSSAGGLCWFEGGVTDSFGPVLAPLLDGLGLLPGTFCPHYDSEPERQPTYRRLVADGTLAPGLAADDYVALRYEGTELAEIVTSHHGARAFRVDRDGEHPLALRQL